MIIEIVSDGNGGDEGIEIEGMKWWNWEIKVMGKEIEIGFNLVKEREGNVKVEER